MLNQILNNRYTVTAQIGRGAMGLVYRAVDRLTREEVAIKVVAHDVAVDAELLGRFRREGEALRQLRHRNIVAFVEMFEQQGQQVIVMEYVPGGNLYSVLEDGPLETPDVVRITLELSDALAQAHHIDIIHRDIKPQNVLLTLDGIPKLTDFGIARLLTATTALTQSGVMIGTPHYMSPEAWQGLPPDAQGDIWSLGVMVYQMASGRLPFAGDTLPVVMNKILTDVPPDLRVVRRDLPEPLVRIVERMLARDRSQRYETMRQLAVDLEQVQRDMRRAQTVPVPRAEAVPGSGIAEALRDLHQTQEMPAGVEIPSRTNILPIEAETPPASQSISHPSEYRATLGAAVAKPQTATPKPEPAAPAPAAPAPATPAPAAPAGRSPRSLALLGAGGLALICVLAVGGYGFWLAAGKYLAPAAPSATPTRVVRVVEGPTNTPWPTATITPTRPTSTSSPTRMPDTPTPTLAVTPTPPTPTLTATNTAAPSPTLAPTMVSGMDGMALVYVPAGKFLMGSAVSDTFAQKNEQPQHSVTLDAFWIDRTDVTNAMYTQCVSAGACQKPKAIVSKTRPDYYTNAQYGNYPVVFVTWDDAKAYCAWAGRRLPTEAEWEKAARGTDGALYPWGNQPFDDTRGALQPTATDTTPVGSYPAGASPYGALDMAGNVWQWVADWYAADYYANSPAQNPTGPANGTLHILRGGSWDVVRSYVRAAVRDSYQGSITYEQIGFRCAKSP